MSQGTRRFLLRVVVSASLLLLLVFVVDVGEVAARLGGMDPGWIVVALALSVVQVLVSAWRWRYTARRLGVRLPMGSAVSEYYLATFLNQVLPGGVLGDVSRAWRHARRSPPTGSGGASGDDALRPVHAVILERASGQLVMTAVALVSAVLLLLPRTDATASWLPDHPLTRVPLAVSVPTAAALLFFTGWLVWRAVRRMVRFPALDRFLDDGRQALLGSALPAQLGLSLFVVATYVAVFVVAARAMGVDTRPSVLVPLVPPLLVTMLIPLSVAGWGVREGAAALLWGAVGLTAAEGVAVSVAYGLLVLVSSLPGAAVVLLTLRSRGDPGRRGDRPPDGSDGSVDGGPRPASPPPEG